MLFFFKYAFQRSTKHMNLLLIKHDTFFTLSYILALIYNTGLTIAFNSRLEAVTMCQNQERLDHGPNLKLIKSCRDSGDVPFQKRKKQNKTKQCYFYKKRRIILVFPNYAKSYASPTIGAHRAEVKCKCGNYCNC